MDVSLTVEGPGWPVTGGVTEKEVAKIPQFLADHRPWLYRLALAMTHDPSLAEELAQETLVRLWKGRARLPDITNFRAYARVALVSVVRSLGRKEAQWERLDELDFIEAPVDTGIEVRQALARLSEPDRVILALHYFEGLSYQAIAADLEIPMGTVASRLSRARAAFREEWS